jgi:hypothetical protein
VRQDDIHGFCPTQDVITACSMNAGQLCALSSRGGGLMILS